MNTVINLGNNHPYQCCDKRVPQIGGAMIQPSNKREVRNILRVWSGYNQSGAQMIANMNALLADPNFPE